MPQPPTDRLLEPVVLTADEVTARRHLLVEQLRVARLADGLSTRQVCAYTGISTGTLWRIETGRVDPHWYTYARLALQCGYIVGVDGPFTYPPGQRPGRDGWPVGYRAKLFGRSTSRDWADHRDVNAVLFWTGAELWWARHHELTIPLDTRAAAALLGINRSTLFSVEHAGRQPRLSSVILVAGLTHRRLVLDPA